MKKQKSKFVLAEASIDDINKQLKINLFVIIVVIFLLGLNALYFIKEKSFFSVALIILMVFLLFIIAKSRDILKSRKQELSN
jgi:Ca2+/Na+ antiporter